MDLKHVIQKWDGKNVAKLKEYLEENRDRKDWIDELLIHFDSNPDHQAALTWLIKNDLQQGGKLTTKQTSIVFSWLEDLKYWEPKLHVLQSLQWIKIPKACQNDVESFLREMLTEKNKFVRAWAYNGFHILSVQYPEYKEESQQLLEQAMNSESASIKTRIRQILKTA